MAHGSDSEEAAMRELNFFFEELREDRGPLLQKRDVSCLIIKPHVFKERRVGQALDAL